MERSADDQHDPRNVRISHIHKACHDHCCIISSVDAEQALTRQDACRLFCRDEGKEVEIIVFESGLDQKHPPVRNEKLHS